MEAADGVGEGGGVAGEDRGLWDLGEEEEVKGGAGEDSEGINPPSLYLARPRAALNKLSGRLVPRPLL